jgi:hypothetical protein
VTLEAFVKEWRTSVAVNLKASTTRTAESHLRAHIIPQLGSLPSREMNTKTVQSFVTYLANGGRSKKTVENVLLTLSSIHGRQPESGRRCNGLNQEEQADPGVKREKPYFKLPGHPES